jgi:hypothetical protein
MAPSFSRSGCVSLSSFERVCLAATSPPQRFCGVMSGKVTCSPSRSSKSRQSKGIEIGRSDVRSSSGFFQHNRAVQAKAQISGCRRHHRLMSQQAGARVLFKDFGIPHVAAQRFYRSMA